MTDGLPALCLATDPIDSDVMRRPARGPFERITNPSFLVTMFLVGFLTAGVAFAVFLSALKAGTVEMARTHAFTALVYAELFRSFGNRSETKPFGASRYYPISISFSLWPFHLDCKFGATTTPC